MNNIVISSKEEGETITVDIMQDGMMNFLDGEELTPLEVSKLALYFAASTSVLPSASYTVTIASLLQFLKTSPL